MNNYWADVQMKGIGQVMGRRMDGEPGGRFGSRGFTQNSRSLGEMAACCWEGAPPGALCRANHFPCLLRLLDQRPLR